MKLNDMFDRGEFVISGEGGPVKGAIPRDPNHAARLDRHRSGYSRTCRDRLPPPLRVMGLKSPSPPLPKEAKGFLKTTSAAELSPRLATGPILQ